MYKMLFFLKKSNEEKILNHFNNFTVKHLSALAGREVKAGKVESNLLLDEKYERFCELTAESKEEMDKMFNSPEGKILNKDLMDFHKFITVISVNFD